MGKAGGGTERAGDSMNEKDMRYMVGAGVIRGPFPSKEARLKAWVAQIEKVMGRNNDETHNRQNRNNL